MSNIQYIKNVTAAASFLGALGQWTTPLQQLSTIPSENPDECVIRSISYLGPSASTKQYQIWCSLINGYIGSVNAYCITTQCPSTRILLNSPIGMSLTFQLHMVVPPTVSGQQNLVETIDTAADGQITILMEFIKYKKEPHHA